MKLGIVITGLGMGGAENHLLKILPKMKIPLFVISLTNDNLIGKKIEKKGIKVYYLGLNKFNLISVIFKFRSIIKKEKPTILNSYLIHSDLFTRFFGRMFGVKKIICSVRNKHINKPFLMFLDKISSRLVNLYLPNSNAIADFMIKKGFSANKIKVLPNGIDLNDFPIVNNKKKNFVIGTVGSLKPKKDQETLIKAFNCLNISNKELIIIGEGELKHKLKKLGGNVKFLGNRKDAKELMQSFDIFVLSSLHEGMSNALLEAMYAKVPVIVSNIEENTELITHNEDGLTFKVKNHKDLLNKMNFSYNNQSKIKKMALNAHKKITKTYNTNKIITKYEHIVRAT